MAYTSNAQDSLTSPGSCHQDSAHLRVALREFDGVGDRLEVLHGRLARAIETLSDAHGVDAPVQ